MTTSTRSTEIVPALAQGRIALRDRTKTLTEVAADLVEPLPGRTPSKEVAPFPAIPSTPTLTDADKEALARLRDVFAKVKVEDRRTLKDEEITALAEERKVLKVIDSVLKGREDVIGEYVRTHVDVDHEERGIAVRADEIRGGKVIVAATPRDAKGHYLLASKDHPTRVPIPGTNEAFSLEFRAGKDNGVQIDSNDLLDLFEQGEITRNQYLALTSARRVFDEEKATRACIADESLLAVIAKVTHRVAPTQPGTSLYVRTTR